MVEVNKSVVDPDLNKKSSTGMDAKVAILLAYIFSWIGGLVFYLIEKENRAVKWNALQALIIGICDVIILIVFFGFLSWIPFIGILFMVLGWLALVASLAFKIIAIVQVFQGKTYRIPGISKLTDKYIKY
ncbi:MAG: DUF4870 domain-containing protein [Actinobacteria bacterium]|nr:DUF4870 domain-containing protein [Actinomycetota bacterium]